MYSRKRHLFHILPPSPWPLVSSFGAFFLLSGLCFYMHRIFSGGAFFFLGLLIVLVAAFSWFFDIINEATFEGDHTLAVRVGLKNGFLLFVVSEIMLFFGFFWAFFHSSFCPSIELGGHWPPTGIPYMNFLDFPFLNSLLLIVSGLSITWAHRSVALGSFSESITSFLATIALGTIFITLQMVEYYEAAFDISDSVYSSTFFMLTGLHGLHVIVGVSFILFCFLRLLKNHFTMAHYLGLVMAIWYWHFVDVVWIILFIFVYCWGNW